MQPQSKPAAPSLVHSPASYVDRLDLAQMFSKPQPLEVELGSGDGGFLVHWAALHPDHNFIGIERLLGRLRKINKKGLRAELQNLRLLRVEASYCLTWLLPPASVTALHVYFADPWPKRRHWKNRLVNAEFAEAAARALIPGGAVHLRTDHAGYFAQMHAVVSARQDFQPMETPAELAAALTDFEKDFQARGVATLRTAYRLAPP